MTRFERAVEILRGRYERAVEAAQQTPTAPDAEALRAQFDEAAQSMEGLEAFRAEHGDDGYATAMGRYLRRQGG